MHRKICPILGAGPLEIDSDCKEDRCAWWDEDSCTCYFCTIAEALTDIAVNVEERKE